MKTTDRKLDLFKLLDHISTKDASYYAKLSEEEQKAFAPLVIMRWLAGTPNKRQIYFINELANPSIFASQRHKELLYYLLTVCTLGKKQTYVWNKTISKKSTSMPNVVSIIRQYFGYSTTEALESLPLLTNEDVLSYAEQLGTQPDIMTKLKKELKNR